MTRKRLLMIIIIVLVLGALMMVFSLNGETKAEKEAKRNREYEVSLVKALKRTYKDLEEVSILTSGFEEEKPGGWYAKIRLTFTDGTKIEYGIGHNLGYHRNASAIAPPQILYQLENYLGDTTKDIKIIYSDGEESVD